MNQKEIKKTQPSLESDNIDRRRQEAKSAEEWAHLESEIKELTFKLLRQIRKNRS